MITIPAVIAVLGAGFVLLAAIGVVRMPDMYSRLQAASKAASLGAILLAIAASLHLGGLDVTLRAALICGFLFLTAPIAAHVIARAGYRSDIRMADHEVVIDELADNGKHALARRGEDGSASPLQGGTPTPVDQHTGSATLA
ncbi:MAG: monovalent cation/H(+) antiporter subunit G [Myxococcota bacterium]